MKKKESIFHGGRVILFLSLLLLAFISTLAYKEMVRPAANNPVYFITRQLHRPGRKIVVCAGDSITRGQISYNFGNYLAQKPDLQDFQFVNAGINSDLAYNLLLRLDQIISCKPNYIIILIGTNDILASRYPNFTGYYKWLKQLPRIPDIEWYSETIFQIVETLKQKTSAKIALISLPMLGETSNSLANREVLKYNEVIQKVAEQEEVTFLPVYDQQVQFLRSSHRTSAPEYGGGIKQMLGALIDHLIFKKSLDEISLKNAYLLHTDGIHLNTRGGLMIAGQVENFIKNN